MIKQQSGTTAPTISDTLCALVKLTLATFFICFPSSIGLMHIQIFLVTNSIYVVENHSPVGWSPTFAVMHATAYLSL